MLITNVTTNETVTGTWLTETNNSGGVDVTFDGISAPDIQAISGVWTVVECTGEQLIFHMGDNQMTLDKICDYRIKVISQSLEIKYNAVLG